MVEIGNRPILWHIMKHYAHYGFTDFTLCLGYKGEVIKQYFYNYELQNNDFTVELGAASRPVFLGSHDETGWRVTLSDTGPTAMTGARICRIARYIDSDLFLLTYGDGLASVNLRQLVEFHVSHGKIGTITGVVTPSRFGTLQLQGDRVVEFVEKPKSKDGFVNGGFMVFGRQFLDYLSDADSCVMEGEPLERLAQDGQLQVFRHTGFWHCMDTYRDFEVLNKMWNSQNPPWKLWD